MKFKGKHFGFLLQQFDNDRKGDKAFCDVTIVVGDQEFHAHKILLSSISNMLKAMFTIEMEEKYQERVELKEVSSDEMESFLDYVYSGEVTINKDNMTSWIKTSDYFQVEELKLHCINFISTTVNVDNCVMVKKAASALNEPDIELASDYCMSKNPGLAPVIPIVDELSSDDLKRIIQAYPKIGFEKQFFESIMDWVKHNEEERKDNLPELLKLVHLRFLTIEYLESNILNEELIISQVDCQELLRKELLQKLKLPKLSKTQASQTTSSHEFGYFVVRNGQNASLFRLPDLQETQLPTNPLMCEIDYYFCCFVKAENKLFFISDNIVYCLNLPVGKTSTWKIAGQTLSKYSSIQAIFHRGYVYVMDSTYTRKIEIFNPNDKQVHCIGISDLPDNLESKSFFICEGDLAIAAKTRENRSYINHCYVYSNSEWREVKQCAFPCTLAFACNNMRYYVEPGIIETGKTFRVGLIETKFVSSLPYSHKFYCVVECQGNVYGISSISNEGFTVLIWNPKDENWDKVSNVAKPFTSICSV